MFRHIIAGAFAGPSLIALALGAYCFLSRADNPDAQAMQGLLGWALLIIGAVLAIIAAIVEII